MHTPLYQTRSSYEGRLSRLLQVREQEKAFSQRVRGEVQERREEERRVLEEHLQVWDNLATLLHTIDMLPG